MDYNVKPRSMNVAAVTIHVKMGADVKHYPLDTSVTADQDSLVIYPILSKQRFMYKINSFSGKNCDINIDDCADQPCGRHGRCQDGTNNYTCNCDLGFVGTNCQYNIDDCENNPCLNGGQCWDGENKYKCDCKDGFTGKYFSTIIPECISCIYLGTNCEYNIDDCAKSPCKNGGTCIDLINDVQCKCMEGYKGKLCEIDIDECALFPVSRLFTDTFKIQDPLFLLFRIFVETEAFARI